MKTVIEPFRIKTVEPIKLTTEEEREEILRAADFNLFRVKAEDVIIDLLTDSGTGAMSAMQWAHMLRADESYAGAQSFFRFQDRLHDVTGFRHILPTHQGRASERILFELMGGPGLVVPNNAHFDTTRANAEHSGAEAVDLPIPEAADPQNPHPFKGNMDVTRLRALIEKEGRDRVPLVMVTITNNSGGGQPVSLENLRQVRSVCDEFGIPLFLDACRFAENAWFVKTREPGQGGRTAKEIAREMFDLADGATISAKKDGLVNIGGVLLLRDKKLLQSASELLILTEGYVTYGGLSGRDLEAMAQGFEEVLHEDYLDYRTKSTAYLGEKLRDAGVRIMEPPGGHAIYIDAKAFCPHIPANRFPAQAVACGLYRVAGIRSVEVGSLMFPEGHRSFDTELTRLAIPRRVYTQSHIDYVAEAVIRLHERRESLHGFTIVEQSPTLRHFTVRLREMQEEPAAS